MKINGQVVPASCMVMHNLAGQSIWNSKPIKVIQVIVMRGPRSAQRNFELIRSQ